MPCRSSAGSIEHGLLRLGLFSDENIVKIVTRPAASITARSEPVGPQERCFKGPPSKAVVKGGVTVASLKDQEPLSGWHLRFLNSNAAPLGVIEAIHPHLDQAIPL
jgi:hypothetical protein